MSKKERNSIGNRWPTIAKTASANATSVEIGRPQAACAGVPKLKAKKIAAAVTMPPKAAPIGTAAIRGLERVPRTNSCFSSQPITKKKIASKKSAAQTFKVKFKCRDSGPTLKLTMDS